MYETNWGTGHYIRNQLGNTLLACTAPTISFCIYNDSSIEFFFYSLSDDIPTTLGRYHIILFAQSTTTTMSKFVSRFLWSSSEQKELAANERMEQAMSETDSDVVSERPLPHPSFLKLAKAQRFEEMMDILGEPEDYDLDAWLFLTSPRHARGKSRHSPPALLRRKSMDNLAALHLFKGETPLHMLLHYKPTEAVVDMLVDYLTDKSETVPEDLVDIMGRTPLHVGAAKACPALTMARLVSGVSGVMPAVAKDSMGRHPLHWACTNPNGRDDDVGRNFLTPLVRSTRNLNCARGLSDEDIDEDMSSVDNMVQVVFLLLKAYPEAVAIADMNGQTPLDLARIHDADRRILKLLQEAGYCFEQVHNTFKSDLRLASTANSSAEGEGVPVEVTESTDYDDDLSSIGSNGVSLYNRKRKTESEKKQRRTSPWALQVTKIDEQVEL